MIDFDESTITDEVQRQIARSPDARLGRVLASAVGHLHAFTRDVSLTREEWGAGLDFLTAVGKATTPEHDECMLLSDTLGLTTLINLLDDARGRDNGTRASVLGPFYREDAPEIAMGDTIATVTPGKEIMACGNVRGSDGEAIPGAIIDVWLADEHGAYDIQAHGPGIVDLRARLSSDAQGAYAFRTTVPIGYSIPMGGPVGAMMRATGRVGMRPAHIHYRVLAEGYRELVTSVYFEEDPYLQIDAAFGVTSELVIRIEPPSGPDMLPHVPYDFILSRY